MRFGSQPPHKTVNVLFWVVTVNKIISNGDRRPPLLPAHVFDAHLGSIRRSGLFTKVHQSENSKTESYTDRYSSQFKNNYFAEMWNGSQEGSYLWLIDWCITQL